MSSHTIPKRTDLAVEDTWDLESVYANNADWEKDFAKVTDLIPKLAAFKGKLAESAASLLSALKLRDEIGEIVGRLYCYSNMRLHQDTTVAEYQALASRAGTLSVSVSSASSYMTPELLATPPETVQAYMLADKELKLYQHEFDDLDRQRPHVLSAELEQLLAEASEVAQTPERVFEMLNNADLKLPVLKDENGKDVQLTHGNYASRFLESQNRDVRIAGFTGMHSSYNALRNTLAANYAGQVKGNIFFARAHKYGSALEAALGPHNIPVDVYGNLVSTVNSNLPKLHRYLELRKRLLGVDELRICDLYVPMVKEVDYKISHADARARCLEALAPLGKEYVDTLMRGFDQRWVDVHENANKRSGAYSWGSYSTHPFMLLNWQDSMDSMFTLIHEAGHSMHSFLTRQNQPYCYGNYTLFVAEVASICNEMLLTDYLLKNTEDRNLKMYIINHALDGFRATLFRQTLFAEFEKEAHARAEAGEALTPELLCGLYKDLNERYYGAVAKVDDLVEIEWARIPHFYSSFYVYQYATGISAAVALSQQIIAEGKPAMERYLRFLSGGSSQYSLDLLKGAGVDLSTPAPIQQALNVFENYIAEFENLAAQPAK